MSAEHRLLLREDAGRAHPQRWRPQSLEEHRAEFPRSDSDGLIEQLDEAKLRGRGGAGFPTAGKWRSVRDNGAPSAVIANGEEGEPLSIKDRYLLRRRPHLVIDGLLLAREAVGAERAVVYLSSPAAHAAVLEALAHRPEDGVELVLVDPSYVAGEQTSVVAAVNGGRPIPTSKPPRPEQVGVAGRPTLIQNVETLAHAAWIRRHGAVRFREVGTESEPGTFLATVTQLGEDPYLFEAPFGMTLRALLAETYIDPESASGVLAGGYYGGVLPRTMVDVPLMLATLRELGSGLGCGTFAVLGARACPVHVATAVLRYFATESSGQCGVCVRGTGSMAQTLDRLARGGSEPGDAENLQRWASSLRGRGACGLLDGATIAAASLLEHFSDVVEDHVHDRCPVCVGHAALSIP
jgi:NADH:ubiquinone oxidoreductase subunit F (NADH-binding)